MAARKLLLGVVHLAPSPSSAGDPVAFDRALELGLADAKALAEGGVDGIMVENFGDAPFHKGTRDDPVPPDVVAALAVAAREVRAVTGLPIGVNCLRNDAIAGLGAAVVAGASWLRVNVLAGAMVTDQGVIQGEAARLRAYRRQLGTNVAILADLLVKHAVPLAPTLEPRVAARDLAERSGASGLILSGSRTGEPVDQTLLAEVRDAVGSFPIWIGSGLTAASARHLWHLVDGAIVGTALKRGGDVRAPVDPQRVAELRAACRV